MKFRKVLTSIGSLKNDKYYDFSFTEEQIKEAMKSEYDNPLMIYEDGSVITLWNNEGKLRINYFISYYGFEQGLGEHGIHQQANDWITCKCHKLFNSSKRITAKERFDKHIQEIQNVLDESKEDTK